MPIIRILYASTSGHTEFVCQTIADALASTAPDISVDMKRVELASSKDLQGADGLVLASGSWNTGGVEGQLNPHMAAFLAASKTPDLKGVRMAIVGLGDTRYYYTARCTEYLQKFRVATGAAQLVPPLTVINEPYGQEDRVRAWAEKLAAAVQKPL